MLVISISSSNTHPISTEESALHDHNKLATAILMSTNGAFCTPRIVTRSFTTRFKPSAVVVIECMKKLEDQGLGHLSIVSNNKVFYKPIPREESKDQIEKYGNYETYKANFTNQTIKDITPTQFNKLLGKSPDIEVLKQRFGYKEKE